jgi:hypothetical protein
VILCTLRIFSGLENQHRIRGGRAVHPRDSIPDRAPHLTTHKIVALSIHYALSMVFRTAVAALLRALSPAASHGAFLYVSPGVRCIRTLAESSSREEVLQGGAGIFLHSVRYGQWQRCQRNVVVNHKRDKSLKPDTYSLQIYHT